MKKFLKAIVALCLLAGFALCGYIVAEKMLTKNNMTLAIARTQIADYCKMINDMEADFSFAVLPEESDYNKVVATHTSEVMTYIPHRFANALHGEVEEGVHYNLSIYYEESNTTSVPFNFYYNIDDNIMTAYIKESNYNYVLKLDTLADSNNYRTLKLYLFSINTYNGSFYETNYYKSFELKADKEKIVNYTEYSLYPPYDSSKPSDTLVDIAQKTTYEDASYYNCNLSTRKLYSKKVAFTEYLEQVKGVSVISFDTALTNKTVNFEYDYE